MCVHSRATARCGGQRTTLLNRSSPPISWGQNWVNSKSLSLLSCFHSPGNKTPDSSDRAPSFGLLRMSRWEWGWLVLWVLPPHVEMPAWLQEERGRWLGEAWASGLQAPSSRFRGHTFTSPPSHLESVFGFWLDSCRLLFNKILRCWKNSCKQLEDIVHNALPHLVSDFMN